MITRRRRPRTKSFASGLCGLILSVCLIYFSFNGNSAAFLKFMFFTIGGILAIVGISELFYLVFPSMNSLSINQHEIRWRGLFSSGKVSNENVKSIEVIHSLESLGFIRLTLNSNKTIKIPESCYGEFDSDLLNAFKIVCPEVEISENYTLVNT